MRRIALGLASFAFATVPLTANAAVEVAIDLTHQRMHVQGANGTYDWAISSGRSGFHTPGGSFAPTHLERMHYSRKYHMSPMPYSIFFRGGYAIHGTYATGALGRPASHGCVRLAPGNAAQLFEMVKAEGGRISISGTPPRAPAVTYARKESPETGEALVARVADGTDAYAAAGYRPVGRIKGRRVYQAAPAPASGSSLFDPLGLFSAN